MLRTKSPVARTQSAETGGTFKFWKMRFGRLGQTVGVPVEESALPANFCVLPFVSAQVRATGSLSVCCMNTDSARDSDHNEMYLYKHPLKAAVSSAYFRNLKRAFLAGERPASCQRCFDDDDIGVRSRRKNENVNHAHWLKPILSGHAPAQPVVFDLNLGTLCNLKCRTCGPASSSKWVQESVDLFGEDHLPRDSEELRRMPVEESRKILMGWQNTTPDFYATMADWMPTAERLEFFGGEPMLSKQHLELVRKSVREGTAGKQVLRYATNGTVVADEIVEKLWPYFREVHLNVSVDGLGAQFEYIRSGAKWETLLKNLEAYRRSPSVSAVGINITVSPFNIFYLPEMLVFWEKKGLVESRNPSHDRPSWAGVWDRLRVRAALLWAGRNYRVRDMLVNENNYVRTPERFDIRILPKVLKEKVDQKFQRFIPDIHPDLQVELRSALAVMHSEDLSALWPKFIESVWFHDNYRGESFAKCFPEFHAEAVAAGVWYDYKKQPEYFFSAEQLIALGHPAPVAAPALA